MKISNAAALAACDAVVDLLDVGTTNANGKIRIYNGPQPADVDTAPAGSPLTGGITGATQANPVVVTATAHGLSNDDVVYIANIVGMTEINDRVFTVKNVTSNTFELESEDGTGHTAYTSGGDFARGNTLLAELDLSNPAFGNAADDTPGGKATANAISDDTSADATGTASWFRAVDRDVTSIVDGTASDSGAELTLDDRNLVATQTVKVNSWTVTMPES